MNRIVKFLALVIVILNFGCENTEVGEPVDNELYYKLFGSYYNDYLSVANHEPDGGLLIAGYSQLKTEDTWAYISKALPSGMLDWDTILSANANSKAFDIQRLQNNISVACTQEHSEDSTWLYILTFTEIGDISDSVSVKVKATEIQNVQIIQQNDGSVRLLSQIIRRDKSSNIDYGFLMLHDLNAGVLEESFSMELNQQILGKVNVQYATENTIYVTATVLEQSNGTTGSTTDIRVLFINGNAVEWDNNYGEAGISESSSDIMLVNNSVVIAGNHKVQNEAQQIYLLTLNPDGIEQSGVQIGITDVPTDITCASFTLNDSSNYVFCGDVKTGTASSDILFLETRADGSNIRNTRLGNKGAYVGANFGASIHFLSSDNAYLLTGVMETINNFDIGIFKLNRRGEWIEE